jgi:hypothetical protein
MTEKGRGGDFEEHAGLEISVGKMFKVAVLDACAVT